jgi:hypothetical protein
MVSVSVRNVFEDEAGDVIRRSSANPWVFGKNLVPDMVASRIDPGPNSGIPGSQSTVTTVLAIVAFGAD